MSYPSSDSRSATKGISRSATSTEEFGRVLGRGLKRGTVVSLDGTLGSGKTCLAKGILSEFAGVPINSVTSPAYTLVNEYGSPVCAAHMDFYRIDHLDGADAELLEDYFQSRSLLIVAEWGEKFIRQFTKDYVQ